MKILILGGSGYLGTSLLAHLVSYRHLITVADVVQPFATHTLGRWIEADLSLPNVYNVHRGVQLGEPPEVVVDLACARAGEMYDSAERKRTSRYFQSRNCVRLTASLRRQWPDTAFILASSCSLYRQSGDERLARPGDIEHRSASKLSDYEYIKQSLEESVLAQPAVSPTIVLRLATLFGAGSDAGRTRYDTPYNAACLAACGTGDPYTLFGPAVYRPYLHVDDAARVIAHLVGGQLGGYRRVNSGVYNVVGENLTKQDIFERVGGDGEGSLLRVDMNPTICANLASYRVADTLARSILGDEIRREW